MAGIARLGDTITGTTDIYHQYHYSPTYDEEGNVIGSHIVYDSPLTISGSISSNCSPNVYVNGQRVAFVGSTTIENDGFDNGATGHVSTGSSKVYINGNPVARIGDSVATHSGSGSITGGSANVFAN